MLPQPLVEPLGQLNGPVPLIPPARFPQFEAVYDPVITDMRASAGGVGIRPLKAERATGNPQHLFLVAAMVPRCPPITARPSERMKADSDGPRLTVRLRSPCDR